MAEHKEPIPSRIYNSALGGHVAGANDIIDDVTGLTLDEVTSSVQREYNLQNPNGMGKIVLKKNNSFISQITKINTIYVIQYDYILNDDDIVIIPEGCILEFDGGSISNGTLVGNNTILVYNQSLNNILTSTLEGTWKHEARAKADEEDITDNNGALKFKDKAYAPAQFSGLGRVYLRKNMVNGVNTLTQDMFYKGEVGSRVPNTNTIFVIQYDYDLDGEEVTVPEGCVLEFDGGSLSNGELVGQNTAIETGIVKIFETDVEISGSWNVSEAYPEWFGAVGDGIKDDTEAIRASLHNINNTYIPLVFQQDKKYIVSDTLNYYNSLYFDVNIVICGSYNKVVGGKYNGNKECGIILNDKTKSLFKNAIIRGTIHGVRIFCKSNSYSIDPSSVFYNCTLRELTINECHINSFNTFVLGSKITQVTKICNNRIAVCYFSKTLVADGTNIFCHLIDSFIENNFITGLSDDTNCNNVCFSFTVSNGSYIRNNFIDYYRIIYDFKESQGTCNINSISNHYQVFLYFYNGIKSVVSLTSIGDAFNWTNPNSTETIIGRFPRDTYVGEDGETYEIPTYILYILDNIHVVIRDCVLENNLGNIIFIASGITQAATKIEFTCNLSSEYLAVNNQKVPIARKQGSSDERPYNVTGTASTQIYLDKYCIEEVSALKNVVYKTTPIAGNYSKYIIGEKVKYKGRVYTLCFKYRDTITSFEWVLDNILDKDLTTSRIVYNSINALGTLSMLYSTCYVASRDEHTTISTINVPESLKYIPLTIFNYDTEGGNTITISALKYNNENVVLKRGECCTFIQLGGIRRVLAVSTFAKIRGTTAERPNLTSNDKGSTYWDFNLGKEIIWNGESWVGETGAIAGTPNSGTFANKPTVDTNNIPVGFRYFCTDKQTVEGATDGIEIIYKGKDTTDPNNPVDVWVDALGRVVS